MSRAIYLGYASANIRFGYFANYHLKLFSRSELNYAEKSGTDDP